MALKTSCFSRVLFLEVLRRNRWFLGLFLGALLLHWPMAILSNLQSERTSPGYAADILHYSMTTGAFTALLDDTRNLLLAFAAIAAGLLVLRGYQRQTSSDWAMSLPLSRQEHFWSAYGAGAMMLAVPIGITALVLEGLRYAVQKPGYTQGDVAVWLGFSLLMSLVLYCLTVFSGSLTGNTLVQGTLTLVFSILPAGVLMTLERMFTSLVWGFNGERLNRYLVWSPLYRIVDGCAQKPYDNRFTVEELWVYIGLVVVLTIAAAVLFEKRNNECVGEPVSVLAAGIPLKLLASFSTALLAGFVAANMANGNEGIYLGYFAGGIIGYILAEMIVRRSLQGGIPLKPLGGAILMLTTGALLVGFDVTGYSRWIPEENEVKGAVLLDFSGDWFHPKVLESPEIIRCIRALHQAVREDGPSLRRGRLRDLTMIYKTLNGQIKKRSYLIDERKYENLLNPIYDSPEVKQVMMPGYSVQPEAVKYLEFSLNYGEGSEVISDSETVREALEALRRDCAARSWEPLDRDRSPRGTVAIHYKKSDAVAGNPESESMAYESWYWDDQAFGAFLRETGILERTAAGEEDTRVLLWKVETPEDERAYFDLDFSSDQSASTADKILTGTDALRAFAEIPVYYQLDPPYYRFEIRTKNGTNNGCLPLDSPGLEQLVSQRTE